MSAKKGRGAYYKFIGITAAILAVIIIASCQSETTTTTTNPPTQTFAGLELATFNTEDFTGSGNCAVCHTNLSDAAGSDVSVDTHWRSTMMANAAKDPLWQAMVASEVSRNPQLKEVIEDKCASCHMPMAYTQADTDGSSTLMFDEGFLNESNPLNEAAMDGNSCTLCHQIVDPELGTYHIDTSTDSPDRLLYGPYEGYSQSTMKGFVGYTNVYGEQTTGSTLCGSCH
jgi:hypothetical protein